MLTGDDLPLLARLRAMAATGWHPIGAEAADEIDRLRAAVQHEADCVEAAKAEIDRLTRENEALKTDLDSYMQAANVLSSRKARPEGRATRGLTLDQARAKVARNRSRLTLATLAEVFKDYPGPEVLGTVLKK